MEHHPRAMEPLQPMELPEPPPQLMVQLELDFLAAGLESKQPPSLPPDQAILAAQAASEPAEPLEPLPTELLEPHMELQEQDCQEAELEQQLTAPPAGTSADQEPEVKEAEATTSRIID